MKLESEELGASIFCRKYIKAYFDSVHGKPRGVSFDDDHCVAENERRRFAATVLFGIKPKDPGSNGLK